MANFRRFKIVTFSTIEQKGSQELNLNLIGVNKNKTLYLKPFVIPAHGFSTVLTKLACVRHKDPHLTENQ